MRIKLLAAQNARQYAEITTLSGGFICAAIGPHSTAHDLRGPCVESDELHLVLLVRLPDTGACALVGQGVGCENTEVGVDHETFIEQARSAVARGAAGTMAGRSLWKTSMSVSAKTREDLLTNRALPRLKELRDAVNG